MHLGRSRGVVWRVCVVGCGAADCEALGVVDTVFLEQIERGVRFGAFGDCFALEAVGEVDDCLDDVLVLGVLEQVANEFDVDLHGVLAGV